MSARSTASARRAWTNNPDPAGAARELAAQLASREASTTIFFCSARYELDRLAQELLREFDGKALFGCTTAGEIGEGGYRQGSVAALSLAASQYVVVSEHVEQLSVGSVWRVYQSVQSLLCRLRMRASRADASNTFAVLLIDGLSGIEESVVSAIKFQLGDIPLVGASAGDDLSFRETAIFHGGAFHTASAVLALVHTQLPFHVFKTQHIVPSDRKMVVTEADPVRRLVTEINAEPADEEYARLCGLEGQHLRPMVLAKHPLVVRVGGEAFARSIQKVNDDGSLTFYCAIDEGLVLSAGKAGTPDADLEGLFRRIGDAVGVPEAVLGFDCIFRKLELSQRRRLDYASQLLSSNNVIGFSTYGEQFDAMHLNQTFTGVALGAVQA